MSDNRLQCAGKVRGGRKMFTREPGTRPLKAVRSTKGPGQYCQQIAANNGCISKPRTIIYDLGRHGHWCALRRHLFSLLSVSSQTPSVEVPEEIRDLRKLNSMLVVSLGRCHTMPSQLKSPWTRNLDEYTKQWPVSGTWCVSAATILNK